MKPFRIPFLALLAPLAAAGCAVAPAAPPPPLVAYPGTGKTADAFRQDDTACRQQAEAPQPAVVPPGGGEVVAPAPASVPERFLQCMAARGNSVAAAPAPAAYAAPYPSYLYAGYYSPGPWLNPYWVGFYAPYRHWGRGYYGHGGFRGPFRAGPRFGGAHFGGGFRGHGFGGRGFGGHGRR